MHTAGKHEVNIPLKFGNGYTQREYRERNEGVHVIGDHTLNFNSSR